MRSAKWPLSFLSRYSAADRLTFGFDAPAAASVGVFNGLAVTFAGIIGRKIGLDAHMLAILGISAYIGLILNLWIGHLSARGHVEAWVLVPSILSRFLVAFALIGVSPWFYLSIMSIFNGLANLSGPAYASIMRSNYSDRHRGELMGYIRVLIQVTTALSAAFAGWIMEAVPVSQHFLFPVAAAFGIASSLLFFRIKVRSPEGGDPVPVGTATQDRSDEGSGDESHGFLDSFVSLARDRSFLVYMGIYFVIGFPDKIVIPVEPIRFVDELGMSYAAAGFVQGSLPFLGALLGYLIYAKAAGRTNPFLALIITALLSSTRYLNTALAGTAMQLAPGAFLNGMSNAGWDLIPIFSLMLFARGRKLGFYFGFHSTLIGLRGLVGPLVGTWLYVGLGLRISTIYLLAYGLELFGIALLVPYYFATRREPRWQG
ncbi:MAG TPA: MFS transporter [Rectinemataceae bacterium]|nr:MFS transporter [Rectinemataceae bacterium]